MWLLAIFCGGLDLVGKGGKRKGSKVTKGELNRLIDALLHRHFSENVGFILLDGLLHAVVERSPEESALKFIRYNFPALIRHTALKKQGRGKRRQKKK
jgi:hypothetical protein